MRRFGSQFAFGVAGGAARFRCIEAYKPGVQSPLMKAYRVAVDYANLRMLDWRGCC